MSYLNDVILGVIEGVTEFLPISSTGHLLLAQQLLGARSDAYNILIQAGAILAVTVIYWKRILGLLRGYRDPENRDYLTKLAVAFLITAVLGLVMKKLGYELPSDVQPIAWVLVLGGVWLVGAERFAQRLPESAAITMRVAIAVGLAQVVAAMFPGTSRSGATITVALLFGTTNRAAATEFAFLLGIPTMYAASGYALLSELTSAAPMSEDWLGLGIAFVASTVTAFAAVKWLLGYIQTHNFMPFAIYRIIFGGALLVLSAMGLVV